MELAHHGILGQKWGKRNGPPYPLSGGDYTRTEKEKIRKARLNPKYSVYKKKHFDQILEKDSTITTLSRDKDRTKNTDMFFFSHTPTDTKQYAAMFNFKAPVEVKDENGNVIGTNMQYKVSITNTLKNRVKVASEDSAAKSFTELYSSDRDFYNFVNDKNRMQSYFSEPRYRFKGYRESRDVLDKMKNEAYVPTDKDLKVVYRMFNYVIPYDGAGSDSRGAKDVMVQRAKFFNQLKKNGYGAVLDTNDAIYGGYKAQSPCIMFDMEQVVPKSVRQTTAFDHTLDKVIFAGRKAMHI